MLIERPDEAETWTAQIILFRAAIGTSGRRRPARHNKTSLLSMSSGCAGFVRSGRGVPGRALRGSVRLTGGATCGSPGPYGGGRPGSGLPEEPALGV